MAIWEYREISKDTSIELINAKKCPYCQGSLITICRDIKEWLPTHPRFSYHDWDDHIKEDEVTEQCLKCGWWRMWVQKLTSGARDLIPGSSRELHGGVSSLKNLNLLDLHLPTQEIRDYLTAKYEDRFKVHPRKFEDVVASVFHDIGFYTTITNYSGDDGIDVILRNSQNQEIGVQVKRYKNKIEIHQIRELVGALVIKGITQGIFVTTSEFQTGAKRTISNYAARGYLIELMDAPRFYSALEIAQTNNTIN